MADPSRNSLETPTSISRHNVYKLASTDARRLLSNKLPPRVYKRSRVLRARYATIRGRAWNLRFVSTHLEYRCELRVVLHSCKVKGEGEVCAWMVVGLLNDEEDRCEIVRASLESRKVLDRGFGSVWFSFCNVYIFLEREKERERGNWYARNWLLVNILNCGIIYAEMSWIWSWKEYTGTKLVIFNLLRWFAVIRWFNFYVKLGIDVNIVESIMNLIHTR